MSGFSLGGQKKVCQWCQQYQAAQRGERSEDEDEVQPVMPAPWLARESSVSFVTQAFIGINVAVFLGMALAGVSVIDPTSRELLDWGANTAPLTFGGQWWRLITNVFLHIGILHIAFNMWCLWDFGSLAESLYGRTTYAFIYLATGVAGSLASAGYHNATVSAGASGAIFGLVGALIASFYLGEFSLPRALIQVRLRSVVIFAGYNLVFGAIRGRTDNAAHIGGLVAGLVLGALIAKFAPDGDALLARVSIMILSTMLLVGSFGWLHKSRAFTAHLTRANDFMAEEKYGEAATEFEAAAKLKPNDPAVIFELAHGYYLAGKLPETEAALKRVIQLRGPYEEYATYELGNVYFKEKKYSDAQATFLRAIAIDSKSAEPHFGLGSLNAAQGQHSAAIEEYKKAASLDSGSEISELHYNMGKSYLELKQYDEAIAAFKTELENSEDDSDIEAGLAAAYDGKGLKQEADQARQKADQLKAANKSTTRQP